MNGDNQESSRLPDDFDLALKAMERAADTARERARRGTGKLVAWRGGRLVEEAVSNANKPNG